MVNVPHSRRPGSATSARAGHRFCVEQSNIASHASHATAARRAHSGNEFAAIGAAARPCLSLCHIIVSAQIRSRPAATSFRLAYSVGSCKRVSGSAYGYARVRVARPIPASSRRSGRRRTTASARAARARHDRAALHRHARQRSRHQAALQPGERSLRALCRAAGRLHRPDGGGGAPRLACRRCPPGRARPTSIRARSASRSPIRGTTTAIPNFRSARSLR